MNSDTKQKLFDSKLSDVRQQDGLRLYYTKHNCKKCYGRGLITRQIGIEKNGKILPLNMKDNNIIIQLCDCVIKNLRKEIDNES